MHVTVITSHSLEPHTRPSEPYLHPYLHSDSRIEISTTRLDSKYILETYDKRVEVRTRRTCVDSVGDFPLSHKMATAAKNNLLRRLAELNIKEVTVEHPPVMTSADQLQAGHPLQPCDHLPQILKCTDLKHLLGMPCAFLCA